MLFTNLLTNMVVSSIGLLSTNYSNKPAFQTYTYSTMFRQAGALVETWGLKSPRPVTTNMITDIFSRAEVEGPNGVIEFSKRYRFSWAWGEFTDFQDEAYDAQLAVTQDVNKNDAYYEQWMRATNLLTMEKAQIIAENVMRTLGIPIGIGKFKKPQYKTQMTYTWKDGKTYPMPFYRFSWDYDGFACKYEVQVSGVTSNVLHCYFSPFGTTIHPTNSMHPSNYFEMLGLPSSPIFVNKVWTPPGKPTIYEYYTNALK